MAATVITALTAIRGNMHQTHPQLVKALAKPPEEIAALLTQEPLYAHILHMAVGIAGEAGEILDTAKKLAIYGQPFDDEKDKSFDEELGDLEFYVEGLRQAISKARLQRGIPQPSNVGMATALIRDENLQHNIDKLSIRYGEKYSDEAAKVRKDKEGDYTSHCPQCKTETPHENMVCLRCNTFSGDDTPTMSPRRGGFGIDFGPEG